ncbi:MAG: DNA primase [Burkholderiaceae bacterium]|nr:DNA primase [Burkholderiaceae bacterium]
MIPAGFLQDLLARADIVDVVGRVVPLKKAGINYKGLCPFHGEKSPSFVVSPSRQTYHCFGCGAHGNAVGFLMEQGGLGFVEAVKELAGEMGVAVPEDERSPAERERAARERERQLTLTEVLAKASRHYRQQLKASPRAIDYLKRRGLSGEIAARFGLGYAPAGQHALASCFAQYDDPLLVDAGLVIHRQEEGEAERRYDRFRDRVMFPIRNPKGEVIGFGGRILDQGEPKYLNSPETPVFVKGRELYGLYEARSGIRERGHALVTEGYMDVVALAQLGFPNAVATLGTACTADHVAKLLRFTEQVVFAFDGDAAGRRAATRALEAVLPHATDTRSFRFLFLPPEHDPDSFVRERGQAAFERCIAEALPLSRQLLAVAGEGCDLATPEGRARMLAQARPLMEQLPDGLLREQLLAELAREGGLSLEALRAHWQATPRRSGRGGPTAAPAPARGAAAAGWSGEAPPDWGSSAGDPGWNGQDEAPYPAYPPQGGAERDGRSGRWQDRPRREGWRDRPRDGRSGAWPRRDRWTDPPVLRPPPRTATLLDRAAWLLVHDAELWLNLPADLHEVLGQQPAPYSGFFAAIERLVHDQGPLPMATLLDDLTRGLDPSAEADSGLARLVERLRQFHEPGVEASAADELHAVLRRLHLQAVDDEIALLLESGELSPAAAQRRNELIALRARLKMGESSR